MRATRKADNVSVAVKFIDKWKIPKSGWIDSKSWGESPGMFPRKDGVTTLPIEAYVLRSVKHEAVVKFIDLFEDATFFYLVGASVF